MTHDVSSGIQKASEAPRDIEIRAIAYVTRQLTEANAPAAELMDRVRALNANSKLWGLLIDDLYKPDNRLPEALKARYISLGLFAQRYSMKALMDRSDLAILIRLNTDVLDALEGQRRTSKAA